LKVRLARVSKTTQPCCAAMNVVEDPWAYTHGRYVPLEWGAAFSRPSETHTEHTLMQAWLPSGNAGAALQVTSYESSLPAERSSRITPTAASSKSGLGCNGHCHKQSGSKGPAWSKCISAAGIYRICGAWRCRLGCGFKVIKRFFLNCQLPD